MLRLFAGTLLSGTLLSGPVAGSSFLVLPAMDADAARSIVVIEDNSGFASGVDAMATSSHDETGPSVIRAPDYVAISRSILAMVSTGDAIEASSIAALDNDSGAGEVNAEPSPRRQARRTTPMVIRGGLIGWSASSSRPEQATSSGSAQPPAMAQPDPSGPARQEPPSPEPGPRPPSDQSPSYQEPGFQEPGFQEPAPEPFGLPE